jgi:hypothetical protein
VVAATTPGPVIERRARLGVRIGQEHLSDRIGLTSAVGDFIRQREPLDPVMVGPRLDDAMYTYLDAIDRERLLPGLGLIPDDTVTMLETNPRFVEAFLIGANHEMNRELLWRRYPTDRRGTPIRRFWDRVDGNDDIRSIHEFAPSSRLGENGPDTVAGSLVLLVKGRLLRRFPNASVFAQRARADRSLDPMAIRQPAFWGRLGDDVTFVGFDLTVEEVAPAPGWYFIIAEQPSEPRFGFDEPVPNRDPRNPDQWNGLDWEHLSVDAGQHLRVRGSPFANRTLPLAPGAASAAKFGRNSADMAAITFQRPFRAAIHSSRVIAGAQAPGPPPFRPVLTHSALLRPILTEG